MDKNMKYVVLVAVGGVGVYLLWKGNYLQQWFPSLFASGGIFAPGAATPATVAGQSATCTALAQKVGGVSKVMANDPLLPKIRGIVTLSADQEAMLTACGGLDLTAGQLATIQTAIAPKNLPPSAPPPIAPTPTTPATTPVTALPPVTVVPTPQIQPPAVTQSPNPTQAISQQMVALAGMSSGLGLDQWCFYFTEATGNDCPFDQGSIDPQTYADAGIVAADGSPGDRSTPTDIGTWLAMAQLQAPQLGLTGIEGLAALHVANEWLV
jgi:hypothetical protein